MRIAKPISNAVAETLQWLQPETMLGRMALHVCSSRNFLIYFDLFSPIHLDIACWYKKHFTLRMGKNEGMATTNVKKKQVHDVWLKDKLERKFLASFDSKLLPFLFSIFTYIYIYMYIYL